MFYLLPSNFESFFQEFMRKILQVLAPKRTFKETSPNRRVLFPHKFPSQNVLFPPKIPLFFTRDSPSTGLCLFLRFGHNACYGSVALLQCELGWSCRQSSPSCTRCTVHKAMPAYSMASPSTTKYHRRHCHHRHHRRQYQL